MNFSLEKHSAHVNNRFRSHWPFLFTSQRKPLFTSPESLFTSPGTFIHFERNTQLVLITLYSPFMCAGHCATGPLQVQYLEENPEAVKKGLEILTESQFLFVRACIKEGVDGFYASTQGGEANRFSSPAIFLNYVKPFDLVSLKEIAGACPFNILHVCDYVQPYANYDAFYDYPGHIVNCNVKLSDHLIPAKEIARAFRRPFMGGMDRHGMIASHTPTQVETEIRRIVKGSPTSFILGADCTVEANTDWDRLKQAISVAHRVSVA